MESHIVLQPVEEPDAIPDQDRKDRVTKLIRQPEPEAFAGDRTASDKPDAAELRPEPSVHELRQVARVELDRLALSR